MIPDSAGRIVMYKHTQILGWQILIPVTIGIFVTAWLATTDWRVGGIVTCLLLAAALVLFFSLTVKVDRQAVIVAFGPGLVHKRIPLAEVRACRTVRNKWYYGWGLRIIPGGLLYNVAGLDAVELEMNNGHRYRIGTDEPDVLRQTISQNMGVEN
jgi:hypothetical protein